MEDLSFGTAGQPEKPRVKEPEKDSDDDDEEEEGSLFRKLFSKSDKEAEKPKESAGIFERFKKKANAELKDEPDEANIENGLTQKEKPLAASSVAEAMAGQVPEHAADEAVTEQVAEDVAAREYLEDVAATGDIEAAAARKMAELSLDPAEVAESEPEPAAESEAEPETGGDETEPDAPEEDEELVFDRSAETGPDDEEEDDTIGTATPPPPLTPPPPPSGPDGPTPPFGPELTPPDRPAPIPTLSGNIMNGPITPNSSPAEIYDQGNPAVTALIGGIIGYYIGRRRGRIKTEKKLLPIQKKLEHQVEDLHWEIKRKEITIRKAAAGKARRDGPYVVERLAASRDANQEKAAKSKPEPDKAPILERLTVERRPAPEASQLHGPAKTHEQIGRVLVTAAEAPLLALSEKVVASRPQAEAITKKASEKLPTYLTERQVETLNRNELLLMSEKIVVDGSTLRQIYETHLIGERGLRSLVAEHLRGGDVKKILRREILEHEIDFERDPAVRDVRAASGGITTTTSTRPVAGKAALDKLVEQASAGFGDGNAQAAAYYKARAAYEAREHKDEKKQRRLVDVGLTVVITVLIVLVAMLYFRGR